MSGCLAPSLRAASLLLTSLSTEMFFSLSALGRDLSCYPSHSMSVNFPCATGPRHKCISVGGGACRHCQLRCSRQSAQLHSSPRRRAPQQVISLAESLLPAGDKKKKKYKKKLHHSNLTGKAGDLLTQSKLFIFRLVGGGSGYINKKAALSLSKHGACMACVITMTGQFSTRRTEWEPTANALCVRHRGVGISLEVLWLQGRTQHKQSTRLRRLISCTVPAPRVLVLSRKEIKPPQP